MHEQVDFGDWSVLCPPESSHPGQHFPADRQSCITPIKAIGCIISKMAAIQNRRAETLVIDNIDA